MTTYTCAECGGTFDTGRPDAEAHAEARDLWGVDGHAPGMVVVCDDCYREIRRRVASRCDHKFIDSVACVKCGWRPDTGGYGSV